MLLTYNIMLQRTTRSVLTKPSRQAIKPARMRIHISSKSPRQQIAVGKIANQHMAQKPNFPPRPTGRCPRHRPRRREARSAHAIISHFVHLPGWLVRQTGKYRFRPVSGFPVSCVFAFFHVSGEFVKDRSIAFSVCWVTGETRRYTQRELGLDYVPYHTRAP